MINGYSIKKINGNDILYLYFDFNYEFSLDNFNFFKKNIEENISDFIKRNMINFKGTTILLVSGGVLFGSINLNTPTYSSISMENPISYNENINLSDNEFLEPIEYTNNETDQNNNEITTEKIDNITIEKNNENKEETNKEIKYENKKIETPKEITSEETEKPAYEIIENNTPNKIEEPEEKVEVDNNIYINVRTNGTIKKIELEEYVIGVVGAEMPASFDINALKAQAIIARTYALKAQSNGQILTDNESTQSYKNNDELHNMWGSSYNTYYNKIKQAVIETKGMYLSYNGKYIEAVYHSTSNGKTESSENVWGNYYPYLVSTDSIYDNINPSYEKNIKISYEEISNKLGFQIDKNTEFSILEKTIGNRVKNIIVDNNIYSGIEFRKILGLRSADFSIEKTDDGVIITTIGYGHGVGLSQYGANGMAKNGFSYIDILKHYYNGVEINFL